MVRILNITSRLANSFPNRICFMQYRTVQYSGCFVFSVCMLLQLLFADLRLSSFPLPCKPVSRRTRALALLNRVTDPNTHISYHATLRISYFYIYPIVMGWSVDKGIVFYYATLMHQEQFKCMSLFCLMYKTSCNTFNMILFEMLLTSAD